MSLLLENVLRRDGNARSLLPRHREHLIIGVGVQRLQASKDAGHGLQGHARNIVEGLLAGEVDARGLGMKLEAPRLGVLGSEPFARQSGPDASPRTKFGDL